jgi:hypothetical protein
MSDQLPTDPAPAPGSSSPLAAVLNAVERLAVVGGITYVWGSGKLDSTLAVVALLAVVGVSMGERKFGGGKGGASVVLALTGVASSLGAYVI